MTCLQESSPTRHCGIVRCDEEGCEFRRVAVDETTWHYTRVSEADCLLETQRMKFLSEYKGEWSKDEPDRDTEPRRDRTDGDVRLPEKVRYLPF